MNKNVRDVVLLTIVFFALCFIVVVLKSGEGPRDDTSRDSALINATRGDSPQKPVSTGSGYPIDLQRWEVEEDANTAL